MDDDTRKLALDAIDDAFKADVGRLFSVMISSNRLDAAKVDFGNGLFIACSARLDAIDTVIKSQVHGL